MITDGERDNGDSREGGGCLLGCGSLIGYFVLCIMIPTLCEEIHVSPKAAAIAVLALSISFILIANITYRRSGRHKTVYYLQTGVAIAVATSVMRTLL